jgi:hypothetical protein
MVYLPRLGIGLIWEGDVDMLTAVAVLQVGFGSFLENQG